jgi:hypothetical protein
LDLPQRFDELLDQAEVRTQPPEQEDQQQGYQGDNYQVFQINSSVEMSRPTMRDACD